MSDLRLKLLITATNDSAIRSVNQVDQSIRGVGKSAKETIADLAHISGAILLWQQFASSPLAVVAALARVADEMKGVEARVKLSSASFGEFNRNMAAIRATAQAAGTEVSSVAALFNRIATPIRDMGGSAQAAQVAVALVGNALRISGASASESSAAMLQFAQAMGSGVLRGEELNSILENAPRLAQAIAAGLGVTIGELKKLGEEGALTSQQVLKAVRSQQNALADEASRLPQTVGQAWTNLGEAAKQYAGNVDKAYGATAALASGINALAGSLPAIVSGLGQIAVVAGVAFGANRVAAIVALGNAKLADAEKTRYQAREDLFHSEAALVASRAVRTATLAELDAIAVRKTYITTTGLAVLADERRAASARLVAANQGVGTAAQAAATASAAAGAATLTARAMGVASVAGRGFLALFGGPLGLAITAITAGVFAFEHFAAKSKDATAKAGESIKELSTRFAEFSGKSGIAESSKALSELKEKAAEARDKLASPLFRASPEGVELAADLRAAEAAIEKFEQRVVKFNNTHAKERGQLGLDKLKPDAGGLVEEETLKKLNAFSTLYKDVVTNAIADNGRFKASAVEVKAALAELLSSAKTPAEFTGLVNRIGAAMKSSPNDSALKSALENALEGRVNAEMKALDGMVGGLEARAKRTQALFASAATVALGQFNQSAAISRVAADLNNDTAKISRIDTRSRNAEVALANESANLQIAAVEQVASRKRELIEQVLNDSKESSRNQLEEVRQNKNHEEEIISGELAKGVISAEEAAQRRDALFKASLDKKVAAGVAASQAERDNIRQTANVDADAAQKRAAIAENLYKTLQSKSSDALSQYKDYAQQVIGLDKQIANNRLDTASAIAALQRSGMTPKEQVASMRDELGKVKAATELATSPDQKLELLNRQKALAQQIGSASGDGLNKKDQIKEGADELARIGVQAEQILQAQRDAAAEAAALQLKNYQDMTTAMNNLAAQVTALNQNAAINLKPQVDKESLDGAIQAVKQAFAGVTIPIKVQPVGLPGGDSAAPADAPARAYGGPLPGRAPHDRADNMLYWGTPGEWVIQRPAARYYGSAFMAALNAMRLPKFASGGQIGSAVNRLSIPSLSGHSGSSPAASGNNLTLDFGKLGAYHATASQDTTRELERVFARAAMAYGRR